VFGEYNTSISVMIVLEGDEPLGAAATNSTTRWSPSWRPTPSTSSTSRTSGRLADHHRARASTTSRLRAVYIAGEQGEALANESVHTVREIASDANAPEGLHVYVTDPRR
jgi:RND superfamily putative drug exporter